MPFNGTYFFLILHISSLRPLPNFFFFFIQDKIRNVRTTAFTLTISEAPRWVELALSTYFILSSSLFFPSNKNKLKTPTQRKKDEIYPERVMESSLELNNGTALWLPFTQLSKSGLSGNEVE